MKNLEKLINRIIQRVNINLREFSVDMRQYLPALVPVNQLTKFYAFYGISPIHPLHFHFSNSNLAGSYFLGKCEVDNSILYKCDIRGDELKEKGDISRFQIFEMTMDEDETIRIKDSFLIKTLVHNFSHDLEMPDLFLIKNTISAPYSNIHGSCITGCFLGPFSTVDMTTLHDCIIGPYSYVQVGELSHQEVAAGHVWIREKGVFDFDYLFPPKLLRSKYVALEPGKEVAGMFMDFTEDRKTDFQRLYDVVHLPPPMKIPQGASINRYSVFKGESHISENVLVAQRAFLEEAWLGKGANAQENCYISYSHLDGNNVTAHGATIIYSHLKKNVFVGFNSFLQGTLNYPLTVGEDSIVMPHTIIEMKKPFVIPPRHLVWGYIRNEEDLKDHSIDLDKLIKVKDQIRIGAAMTFKGSGAEFVKVFQHRIQHILEENGAFFDGKNGKGHAQKAQDISFNIIHPYSEGSCKGLYPTIDFRP